MDWSLLEGLDEADRRLVLSMARRRKFARGEVVFHEGDPGNAIHLVEKGHFAVRITTPLGDVAMLQVVGPGGSFGELSVLDPAPRSATVAAVTKGETLSLTEAAITELRASSKAVDEVLLAMLVADVRRLSGALVEALYVPVQKRILRRLCDLAGVFGGAAPVLIPVTQEELAQMAGTTRPTANRVLQQLEAKGLVAIGRGRLEVLDLEGLARQAR